MRSPPSGFGERLGVTADGAIDTASATAALALARVQRS